jgi:hypothetical protein
LNVDYINFQRLLTNKGVLQPFIDQFLEAMFANTSNLPPVVQHLFEFIDQELRKYTNSSNHSKMPSLARSWKSSIYFERYWLKLLRRPDILFKNESVAVNSMKKSHHQKPIVKAHLDAIAEVLSESFNTIDSNDDSQMDNITDSSFILLKNQSSSSLINQFLFIRDQSRYKQHIDTFYDEMNSYQSISDHELHFYLTQFSKQHGRADSTNCSNFDTLNKQTLPLKGATPESIHNLVLIYQYYEKYETEINERLGQNDCAVLLPVHHRLIQIKELMSTIIQQPQQPNIISNPLQQSQLIHNYMTLQKRNLAFNNNNNNNNNNLMNPNVNQEITRLPQLHHNHQQQTQHYHQLYFNQNMSCNQQQYFDLNQLSIQKQQQNQ